MKLQYLGDSRDAFKWDLLHWICTRSSPSFDKLAFVPLLTPNIEGSNEGRTPAHLFKCRCFVHSFVASLKDKPRSLARIETLGTAEPNVTPFHVSVVFGTKKFTGSGKRRAEYWSGFEPEEFSNSVVFFDPDNGFETKTRRGEKWIRHTELKDVFSRLPETSVAVVYQHRPRRKWDDLFVDLKENLGYVHTAIAAYESNLAFVAMAGTASAGKRVLSAIQSYADEHLVEPHIVRHSVLRNGYA